MIDQALLHLKKDSHFAPLIKKHGPPDLKRGSNVFESLCRAIVYQQLSGKAAKTIFDRFRSLFSSKTFPSPRDVNALSLEALRACGLSNQKASYLRDLSEKFSKNIIDHKRLSRLSNEDVVKHLVQVKGIGPWTVDMFLIFTLNRPDILPVGDLGIQKGFQIVYGLKKLPSAKKMEELAKPWRQYASIASWYLWRAADEAKIKN